MRGIYHIFLNQVREVRDPFCSGLFGVKLLVQDVVTDRQPLPGIGGHDELPSPFGL
jgi:hypothetical protein